jgi:hypothetical protein
MKLDAEEGRNKAHTVSTSRILSQEEFQQIEKGKAAKVVEGTTKGKKKHTEEETQERLVVWLFLDIMCVYYLILLKTNVFQDFLFNNNTFCLK